jgi:flagellar protein FliJ
VVKKFEFRLQGVLNYRKQMEDARVRELATAKGALLQVEEALKSLSLEEAVFFEDAGSLRRQTALTADQAVLQSLYWDRLLTKEKVFKDLEKQVTEEVETRRQKALAASRDKKLLENLKERKLRVHQAEVAGEEQRFLDEHSAVAFVRRERMLDQVVEERETLGR